MPDLLALIPDLGVGPWLLLAIGALIVGTSKTAMPGAGTLAVGLFALAMPAKESTAALLILLIIGDMTALWVYRREPDVRTLIRLLPSAMVGVVIGVFYFAYSDGPAVRATIGVILLVLVVVTVWRRHLGPRLAAARKAGVRQADGNGPDGVGPDGVGSDKAGPDGTGVDAAAPPPAGAVTAGSQPGRAATAQGIGYGLLGGFTTMVANAAGPVMSMYFYAMKLPVLTFLGTSAWYFAIVNIFKLPFSAGLGLITRETLVMDALLVPLVLIGAYVGAKVAKRIPQKVFENLVLVLTVASAIGLLAI